MHRSDGEIPLASIRLIGAMAGVDTAAVHELYQGGLWALTDTGYRIADLLGCELVDGTLEQARDEWNRMRATLMPVILRRDNHTCQYCGAQDDLTIDHITPLARGGTNVLDNLQAACRSCNSAKGARTPEEWR